MTSEPFPWLEDPEYARDEETGQGGADREFDLDKAKQLLSLGCSTTALMTHDGPEALVVLELELAPALVPRGTTREEVTPEFVEIVLNDHDIVQLIEMADACKRAMEWSKKDLADGKLPGPPS